MAKVENSTIGKYAAVIFTAIILIGVAFFIINLNKATTKETEAVVNADSFELKGMYGGTYVFKDVTSIELKDTIPAIKTKTNGAGLGESQKGEYVLEEIGDCHLMIASKKGPFIYVMVNEKHLIINYRDEQKTRELYQKLLDNWKK